jgi:uncharacterized membrane protein YfcA
MIAGELLWVLAPLFFGVAVLYSSVGHGGASGYLALFTLAGVAATVAAPVALVLNVVVATISFLGFRHAGHFRQRLLLPFVLTSVPCAYLGGLLAVPESTVRPILGVALLLAAGRLLLPSDGVLRTEPVLEHQRTWLAPLIGALLGFVSGMIGIGGGVFLSPILLFLGWADLKTTAATSAAFIVLNSISGLLGHAARGPLPWIPVAVLALAVGAGGLAGSLLGAQRFRTRHLRLALAAVLVLAGAKLTLPTLW